MSKLRSLSEPAPSWGAALGGALAELLARGAAMGLLGTSTAAGVPGLSAAGAAGASSASATSAATLTAPDGRHLARLVQALRRHGIGGDATRALAPFLEGRGAALDALDAPTQQALTLALQRLAEAMEDSAAPAAEWPAMRAVFGDEMLGSLVEVSPASLRRYAGGERATPQEVAERLHWLALVVADLAGAYNDFGMRRWFERPRSQLGSKSPRQLLGRGWHIDSEAATRVRALASVLRGANPLAA